MPIEGKAAVSLAAKGMFSESEKDALIKLMSDLRVSWPNVKFKLFGSKVKGLADVESDLDDNAGSESQLIASMIRSIVWL